MFFDVLLQSHANSFIIRNENLALFEMIHHRTCNFNLICARYTIGSRSNNDIVTVSTFLLDNIRFGFSFGVCSIIIDNPAVAIIIRLIFYFFNIDMSWDYIIVVFSPISVIVRVSNIMAFVGSLRKMYNKSEEFILLVAHNKLERHFNAIISLCRADTITCKSVKLNE